MWEVEVNLIKIFPIMFIPQSDILVSIRTKGNTFRAEKRYPSLNSLLKNWEPDQKS